MSEHPPPVAASDDPRRAWAWHGRAVAVTGVLSLVVAGVLALMPPTPVLGDTDVRVLLWAMLAVGFVVHGLLSTVLMKPLLRSMPPTMAAGVAHAFGAIGAAGAMTVAIVVMGAG